MDLANGDPRRPRSEAACSTARLPSQSRRRDSAASGDGRCGASTRSVTREEEDCASATVCSLTIIGNFGKTAPWAGLSVRVALMQASVAYPDLWSQDLVPQDLMPQDLMPQDLALQDLALQDLAPQAC